VQRDSSPARIGESFPYRVLGGLLGHSKKGKSPLSVAARGAAMDVQQVATSGSWFVFCAVGRSCQRKKMRV
jgi:hypothetical protein